MIWIGHPAADILVPPPSVVANMKTAAPATTSSIVPATTATLRFQWKPVVVVVGGVMVVPRRTAVSSSSWYDIILVVCCLFCVCDIINESFVLSSNIKCEFCCPYSIETIWRYLKLRQIFKLIFGELSVMVQMSVKLFNQKINIKKETVTENYVCGAHHKWTEFFEKSVYLSRPSAFFSAFGIYDENTTSHKTKRVLVIIDRKEVQQGERKRKREAGGKGSGSEASCGAKRRTVTPN